MPSLWKIKVGLKTQSNAWRNYLILYVKTNKEASTTLCSILKYLERRRAPYTFFVLYGFPRALQQNRAVEAHLFVKYMFSDPIQNSSRIRGKSVLMTFPCKGLSEKERLEKYTVAGF